MIVGSAIAIGLILLFLGVTTLGGRDRRRDCTGATHGSDGSGGFGSSDMSSGGDCGSDGGGCD